MTIGELKRALAGYPESDEIIFGCHELEYYRLKRRGPKLIQLEFNQNIYKDEDGTWHVDDFSDQMRGS